MLTFNSKLIWKEFASPCAEKVTEMFNKYEDVKFEIVEICFVNVLPAYLRRISNIDTIVGSTRWDFKDMMRDIKPNSHVFEMKNVLLSVKALIAGVCTHESQKELEVKINDLVEKYFFREIAESYSKIKAVKNPVDRRLGVD